jgi:hypothetical protein
MGASLAKSCNRGGKCHCNRLRSAIQKKSRPRVSEVGFNRPRLFDGKSALFRNRVTLSRKVTQAESRDVAPIVRRIEELDEVLLQRLRCVLIEAFVEANDVGVLKHSCARMIPQTPPPPRSQMVAIESLFKGR